MQSSSEPTSCTDSSWSSAMSPKMVSTSYRGRRAYVCICL
jgi:hypothetical protein